MTTNYSIDINKASIEDMSTIKGIGKKIAKSVIAQRKLKGILTQEDLKTIPNIPSTLWDPLFDQGIIKVESMLQQTLIKQVQTPLTQTNKIQVLKLWLLKHEGKIRITVRN
jgi:DNA polymerase III alpha subunit (gram-positive type)